MVDLVYQSSVEPEALPGRPFPRLPDEAPEQAFGGDVSRAIGNVGDVMQQHYDAAMSQVRQSQFADADNQIQALTLNLTHNPQTGAFTKQGKNAFGLAQQYLPQFDQASQQILANTPDGRVRQQLQGQVQRYRMQLSEQLDAHEMEQHRQFNINTANSSIDLAMQAARQNYNHPDILQSNLDKVDGSLATLASANGWGDEQFQQAQHQAHAQLYTGVLHDMLSDGKVELAQTLLSHIRPELTDQEAQTADAAISAGQVNAATRPIAAAFRQDTALGAHLVSGLASSGLSEQQQAGVLENIDRERKSILAEQRANPQVAQSIGSLEESIRAEKPSPDAVYQIEQLWHRGAISDDQRFALRGDIDRLNDKLATQEQTQQLYRQAYQQSTPLSPDDEHAKVGIDKLFQDMTASTRAGTPEWSNRAVDVATRTGIVPTSAVRWATANLVSGRPEDAAAAADMIARIDEANPRAADFIDRRTLTMASQINQDVEAGTASAVAVQNARELATQPKALTDALTQQWKASKASDALPGALASLLKGDSRFAPGWFGSPPPVPALMQGQFAQLAEQYYKLTGGNVSQANSLAFAELKRTWGVTEVNGKRELMQYAPETMFPGLTAATVRDDLAREVTANAQAFTQRAPDGKLQSLSVDPSTLRLISTDRTARTGGREWMLGAPDKWGAYDMVMRRDGTPFVYRLPVSQTDYASVQQRQAQAALAAARKEQHDRSTFYQQPSVIAARAAIKTP